MIFSVVIFIFTLLVLVLIHELGHFLVAKKFNIKVLEFGFGIPPRAWGKKVGETLVSINWLPFGGFVRLLGEDEVGPEKSSRDFRAKPVGQRILTVSAGVFMNLILAWIIFYVILSANGFKAQFPLLLDHKFDGTLQQNETTIFISDVAKDSPADKAGIKPRREIVGLNSQSVTVDLTAQIKDLAGQEISLTLKDEKGNLDTVKVTPRKNPPEGEGSLGLKLTGVTIANLEYQGMVKVLAGPLHSWNIVIYSGRILGHFIGQSFRTGSLEPVSQSFSGPVGVSSLVNDILTSSKKPLFAYLDFVGLLSLNLAVFNVLPIPALDGGRLFFLSLEALTRKRIHANFERWVHTVGLAILLTLMALVTFSDIRKIFP